MSSADAIISSKIPDIDLIFVKNYLRVDYEEDDNLISIMMKAAQMFIQSYLNKTFDEIIEEKGEIPDEFTIAYLAIVSHWYDRREIQSDKATSNELSYIFSGILDMHRDWNDETWLEKE